jgi:hypothetical protein
VDHVEVDLDLDNHPEQVHLTPEIGIGIGLNDVERIVLYCIDWVFGLGYGKGSL